MGSTFVPLDSWVYAAFERLAALGYINTEILGSSRGRESNVRDSADEAGEALLARAKSK